MSPTNFRGADVGASCAVMVSFTPHTRMASLPEHLAYGLFCLRAHAFAEFNADTVSIQFQFTTLEVNR